LVYQHRRLRRFDSLKALLDATKAQSDATK
jgi:hypothetical protein